MVPASIFPFIRGFTRCILAADETPKGTEAGARQYNASLPPGERVTEMDIQVSAPAGATAGHQATGRMGRGSPARRDPSGTAVPQRRLRRCRGEPREASSVPQCALLTSYYGHIVFSVTSDELKIGARTHPIARCSGGRPMGPSPVQLCFN